MGHLTPKDEKRIIKLIEEWSEPKLTWPLLVEACKEKLGISRARQSLMNLPAVDLAMKNCKTRICSMKYSNCDAKLLIWKGDEMC